MTLPNHIPCQWHCHAPLTSAVIDMSESQIQADLGPQSNCGPVSSFPDDADFPTEEIDWGNKGQVDAMEKQQREALLIGCVEQERSPGKESAATDDSLFDFDKLEEDDKGVHTETTVVREMINHWNQSASAAADSTYLTYDENGLDRWGRPRPCHWSELLSSVRRPVGEAPDGRKIIRLIGNVEESEQQSRERLDSTEAGTDYSVPGSSGFGLPLLTMPGEDRQDEDGSMADLEAKPPDAMSARDLDLSACGQDENEVRNSRKPATARVVGSKRMRMARGMTVDSGAADNVMPRRMVRGKYNKIRPSQGSRAGVHYVAADNARIANEGECDFKFATKEGQAENFTFQIAEVNKALCAVSYLVDHGHQVLFDQDEKTGVDTSRIINKKTGRTIRMVRDRNVWTIEAFIEEEVEEGTGFGRQG